MPHQDKNPPVEAPNRPRPVCADAPWKRVWKFKTDVGHRSNKWREKHFRFALTLGVQSGQLKRRDVVLLLELVDRSGPSGKAIYGATKKALGSMMHVCERTVAGSLRRLLDGGWIELHHNQDRLPQGTVRQKANAYRLLIPAAVVVLMEQAWDASPNKTTTESRPSKKSGSRPRAQRAGRDDGRRPVGPAYEPFNFDNASTGEPVGAADVVRHLDAGREALKRNKAPP